MRTGIFLSAGASKYPVLKFLAADLIYAVFGVGLFFFGGTWLVELIKRVGHVAAYVLAVPLATYTKAADDATFNAMSVVLIGLLLSLVIGVYLTRSLVGPLRRLVGEATAVSTGDVDLRVANFDTRAGDDITREVASAFDRMLNALRFYALADSGGDD